MVVSAWYARLLILAGALSALLPALFMWGFTVDDALIPLRYAHHLAHGAGYRFNIDGPVTDGVTPLPWTPFLVPLASSSDLMVALVRVKVLGIVVWTVAGALLGLALARMARNRRDLVHAFVALGVIALAFPIGAWAASGLETGFAIALVTIAAVSFHRPRRTAILAGIAASLRPELVVWALVFAAGSAIASANSPRDADLEPKEQGDSARANPPPQMRIARRAALPILMAFTPFAVCALIRLVVFGRAAPLAVLAKPSDFKHGWVYAGAALIVVLTPMLTFAPLVLVRRASPHAKTLAVAAAVHVLVVIAVGGDWMPYARLMVPVAPSLALAFVDIGRFAHPVSTGLRVFCAISIGLVVAGSAAPAGRQVLETRQALIMAARPMLGDARVVASLDVGWVGAATDAEIVDLAGLTDPTIAVLRGGHTSKAVDTAMLLDRHVDTVVIYTKTRTVEERLIRSPLFKSSYTLESNITVSGSGLYAVYRRTAAPATVSD